MTARKIDGKALEFKFRERVETVLASGIQPGLDVTLVGESSALRIYEGNKVKASEECSVTS